MAHRAAENLALLDAETCRLVATTACIEGIDLKVASLCPGWSRAHVLTHIARNADALVNLVKWAADGQERSSYSSVDAREADIEIGAVRGRDEILADLEQTAHRFAAEANALRGPAGDATVRSRKGTPVTGAQVIAMRIVEVVFHHVDLRAGYSFDDADQHWVVRTLKRGVAQWNERTSPPDLTLYPDGMEPLLLGHGGPEVRGTPGGMLLWLARGIDDGLTAERSLPSAPPWA